MLAQRAPDKCIPQRGTQIKFETIRGEYKKVLKLLESEAQNYEQHGDEGPLYRLHRVAFNFCGKLTDEMRNSPEYINAVLRMIKLAHFQKDEPDLPGKLFVFMEKQKVGYRDANRYKKEALWWLTRGEGERALQVLTDGLQRKAQPRKDLEDLKTKMETRQGQVAAKRLQNVPRPKPESRNLNKPLSPTERQEREKEIFSQPQQACSSSDPGINVKSSQPAKQECPRSCETTADVKAESSESSDTSSESEADKGYREKTLLSPIAENVAEATSEQSANAFVRGCTGSVTPREECTPNYTPVPRGDKTRTADIRAMTPPIERHVVHVNGRPYTKIKVIGRGGSCKVYKVTGPDNEIYALKRVAASRKSFESFKNEVHVLEQLRGKDNIIHMIEYELDELNGRILIVLEYGECDFAQYLMTDPVLGIDEIRQYWKAMLLAVQDIHDARIVHSDLKPQNYMLVKKRLKLIDFGIAKDIPNDTTNIQRDQGYGTLSYMAPEANNSTRGAPVKLGRSSDIWSLGIILYQLVYKRPPFAQLAPIQRYILLSDPNTTIEFKALTESDIPNSSEEDRKNLVRVLQSCLMYMPRERFTIPQLLRHPLLHPRPVLVEQELMFGVIKRLLCSFRLAGNPQNESETTHFAIAEDQVCATVWSNLMDTSHCDDDAFQRFARLCRLEDKGTPSSASKTPSPSLHRETEKSGLKPRNTGEDDSGPSSDKENRQRWNG